MSNTRLPSAHVSCITSTPYHHHHVNTETESVLVGENNISQRIPLLMNYSPRHNTAIQDSDFAIVPKNRFSSMSNTRSLPTDHHVVIYDPKLSRSHRGINMTYDPNVITTAYGQFSSSNDSNGDNEMSNVVDLTFTVSTDSAVRVEIADDNGPENSLNMTTNHLRKCKYEVLRPYWRLLSFIGWRSFGSESINSDSCGWTVLNFIYPLCIVILLLYTYAYSMVACQWKLNITKDTEVYPAIPLLPANDVSPAMIPNTTTIMLPTTELSPTDFIHIDKGIRLNPGQPITIAANTSSEPRRYAACRHIISNYGIPSLFHFIAFIMGLYYFRLQENEQLYALMEKVFLQASPLQGMTASQQKLIKRLRLYLAVGAIWVVCTLSESLLFQWAYNFQELDVLQQFGTVSRTFLIGTEIFGSFVQNSINVAVIINFVTQCEMIIFYVKGIVQRFQERASDLRNVMKDVFMLKQSIVAMNGPLSTMTTFITLIAGSFTITGCIILSMNKNNDPIIWVYRAIFFVVFICLFVTPLIQAARTNSICREIVKLGLEARVFGYKTASQLELDSFLVFVSNVSLRVRIFQFPITVTHLCGAAIVIGYMFVIMFQTNVIGDNI